MNTERRLSMTELSLSDKKALRWEINKIKDLLENNNGIHRECKILRRVLAEAEQAKTVWDILNNGHNEYRIVNEAEMNLENYTSVVSTMQQGDYDSMARNRIKRQITINNITKWVTGETEQEYAENLLKAFSEKQQKANTEKHDFKEYALSWYDTYSKPNIAENTQKTYERQMNLHIIPKLQGNIEDLTLADYQKVFNEMGNNVTKATKNKAKNVLQQILEQAVIDGYIDKNPCKHIKIAGKPSESTKLYSVEQMQYLVNSISNISKPYDKAFIALIALHGMRPEEVYGLKQKNIDRENKIIHIVSAVTHPDRNKPKYSEKLKTDKSRRDIQLAEDIIQFLPDGKPEDFVVSGNKPITNTQITRMCQRIQKEIGFDEKITPRRFRTTVLSDLYENTKDIMNAKNVAGHTNLDMLNNHYVKNRKKVAEVGNTMSRVYGLTN